MPVCRLNGFPNDITLKSFCLVVASFSVYFRLFNILQLKLKFKLIKA